MTQWRDTTSASAQTDLDGLLDAALDMAEGRPAERGASFRSAWWWTGTVQ
ncbi:hypothetical protein [Nocardia donostiensis]|nr:hypothetical protein [Nocardia donostiensis]